MCAAGDRHEGPAPQPARGSALEAKREQASSLDVANGVDSFGSTLCEIVGDAHRQGASNRDWGTRLVRLLEGGARLTEGPDAA
jgi:hypothetical protein